MNISVRTLAAFALAVAVGVFVYLVLARLDKIIDRHTPDGSKWSHYRYFVGEPHTPSSEELYEPPLPGTYNGEELVKVPMTRRTP
jgi:hypothetical protein